MLGLPADDFPADAFVIAAGVGIDHKANDGVDTDDVEKGGRATGLRIRARGSRVLVEGAQNLIPLLVSGGGEFGDTRKKFADAHLQGGETFAVGFLIVDGEGGQAAIYEINDPGFMGAGSFVGGKDARGDGVDFGGFFGRKELKLRRRGRLGGLVRVLGSGNDGGPMRGKPEGADGGAATGEKISTAKIFDHRCGLTEQLGI